jgi:DNA-binding transcriptional MocR family regulator
MRYNLLVDMAMDTHGTVWKPGFEGSDQPLYVWLSRSLSNDIERGVLREGTRLPTHRDMADILGVAVGTVTRAYTEAERRGLRRRPAERSSRPSPAVRSTAST